ncbi:olfactory receptor 14J1-like [Aegotheles albertisi]
MRTKDSSPNHSWQQRQESSSHDAPVACGESALRAAASGAGTGSVPGSSAGSSHGGPRHGSSAGNVTAVTGAAPEDVTAGAGGGAGENAIVGRCTLQRQPLSNGSSITQFLLLAFADRRELQLLHFWLFLGISLAALLGNGLIITTIACDHHLHTPMYFFLLNLSLLDMGSISTTVHKSMANSLWDTRAISYTECAAQIFRAVLRIPSEHGQHKAFSTCLPHLAVLSLFLSTAMFAYLKPPSISSPTLDLVVSFLYSVVPPVVNIYSLRNQELKDSLRKLMTDVFQQP